MSNVKSRKTRSSEDELLNNFSPNRNDHDSRRTSETVPNTLGDRMNIAILLFLYILQGVPPGLSAAIPMVLQNKHITYKEQAKFSLSTWPFCLKLFWAPIVDSLFWPKFGRRKTWLVPVQYLIGFFLLFLGMNINDWLVFTEDPNLTFLTLMFFCLNFLAATQDIAVDGWALTMLRKENVGYASTCNSIGHTTGAFLGYVIFITLESPTFCNKWLRLTESKEGIVTLQGFLYFWGFTFMIATTLVFIFKHEKDDSSQPNDLNLHQTYKLLGKIMKLPSVKILSIILLTSKIGFSTIDVVSGLKIIDKGISKDDIAMIGFLLIPCNIILPVFISKYTSGPKPMDLFLKAIPYRLLIGILITLLVYFTPYFIDQDGKVSMFYYVLLMGSYLLHKLTAYSMFAAAMGFFARISDPLFGGTYMTLLKTLLNLGTTGAHTAALWMTDLLTYKQCSNSSNNICSTALEIILLTISACRLLDEKCEITLDGFYLQTALCTVFGILWYKCFSKTIRNLQSKNLKHWHVA